MNKKPLVWKGIGISPMRGPLRRNHKWLMSILNIALTDTERSGMDELVYMVIHNPELTKHISIKLIDKEL